MIKRTGLHLFAFIFLTTLFTSCSKYNEPCPAYTMDYKQRKLNLIKHTVSINQQFMTDNY